MSHDAHHQQGPKQIRGIIGYNHEPVYHEQKYEDNGHGPKQPQLLTYYSKYHIVLGLGQKAQLLYALSQPLAHQSAGTNGVESLENLESLVRRVGLRIQPCLDSPVLIRLEQSHRCQELAYGPGKGQGGKSQGPDGEKGPLHLT